MKKVFPNSETVMHVFAQRIQDEGRTSSGNVYFDSIDKIYSYGSHYLLAQFIDENTIMINDSGYSVTTSKHISQISYATSQYRQFFTTETDIEKVYYTVQENLKALANARKPEIYINAIININSKLNEYLKYTRGTTKAKKNKKYREIIKIVEALNTDSEALKEKLALQKKQAKAKADKLAKKKIKESLPKFENYEINSFRINDFDYLRISADGERVETSQNVKVPVKEARLLYKMILAGKDIKGHKIGYYTVNSINGTLKIGCHNINIDSMHKVGKQLL